MVGPRMIVTFNCSCKLRDGINGKQPRILFILFNSLFKL